MAIAAERLAKARQRRVYYPTSDGEPMGETDKHATLTMYCIAALRIYFAAQPDVYVAGDNFLYYVEGNPRKVVSPDCYVVFGAGMKLRDCYKAWEEDGRLPQVVFEITSKKTRKDDIEKKLPLYEQVLQVPEYFLFDPTGDYLKPRLQGYRLVGGQYARLLTRDHRLHSEQLGLDLIEEGEWLRFYDPVRREPLLTVMEQAQRAEAEAQARAEAEAEIARLRAELEALKRQQNG